MEKDGLRRTGEASGPGNERSARLLEALAFRVRGLRGNRGWTRQELSRRCGLSVRFLARVESGKGNISVVRLDALARALETTADTLVRPAFDRSDLIALVGLRGAGKSTVGPILAERLSVPFIEMDTLIVETSGLALDQLFELHGERYYRRLERETLRRILARNEPAVVAAAGGVVNEPISWELLCERATVVWLRARPEDHWNRVTRQGDHRPMADSPAAMDELRAILGAREKIYSQARLIVDTWDKTPEELAETVQQALEDC
jgi:XRE family aerobic/anaerobic benzoate catabolism transcriptional regulator